jgi:hypothetical protein
LGTLNEKLFYLPFWGFACGFIRVMIIMHMCTVVEEIRNDAIKMNNAQYDIKTGKFFWIDHSK